MSLTKLQFNPGIVRETTSYTNEGGWFDGDKIRFRAGLPEKIKGWSKLSANSFLGICRGLKPWVALDSTIYNGVGTNLKYYIEDGGVYKDVTPIRATTSAGDVTFSATNGSSVITVTDAAHNAETGDFVTFSGAASLGGNITAAVLNQEYQVDERVSTTQYKISARAAGTSIQSITVNGQIVASNVSANSSDTGNGGSSTVGAYQINTGLNESVYSGGWGVGTWGRGTWSSSVDLTNAAFKLRLWSHDNFGEDLIINVREGGIFYWDKSTNSGEPFSRAVALGSVAYNSAGDIDAGVPTLATQVLVSDIDRHVIAFGADDIGADGSSTGAQDPMLIRFSDQSNPFLWTDAVENTAGSLALGSGSKIVCATETRQQILVWTNKALYNLQFQGPPFTFGASLISENVTIASPQSFKAVDDLVFWMGEGEFYYYNGQVQTLPCSVKEYIYSDINIEQIEKVTSGLNSAYSEVWWFYPSSDSTTNNRYVVYNYEDKLWYYGTIARSNWIDRGINRYPIAAGLDGFLYYHEFGTNDGSTSPESAITAFIESSQIDLSDGNEFAFIRKVIPDLAFPESTSSTPTVDLTLKVRNFPGSNYSNTNTSSVVRSQTVPIEAWTDQAYVRLRGRSFALRVESNQPDVGWRLGTTRVDVRKDGRR
jgi:hypothetical protein|tara:strand:+ start:1285 stop:3243 length:1959 start_codon:yes stop_codon:yes gene_type:complete